MRLDPITLWRSGTRCWRAYTCNSSGFCTITSTHRNHRSIKADAWRSGCNHPYAGFQAPIMSSLELDCVQCGSARVAPSVSARGQPSMPDDHSAVEPPLPIPNRTVKRRSADDSGHLARESRTSSGKPFSTKPGPRTGLSFHGGFALMGALPWWAFALMGAFRRVGTQAAGIVSPVWKTTAAQVAPRGLHPRGSHRR